MKNIVPKNQIIDEIEAIVAKIRTYKGFIIALKNSLDEEVWKQDDTIDGCWRAESEEVAKEIYKLFIDKGMAAEDYKKREGLQWVVVY